MLLSVSLGIIALSTPAQASAQPCGPIGLSASTVFSDLGSATQFLGEQVHSNLGELALGINGPYFHDWQPQIINGIPGSPFYKADHTGNNAHIHLSFLDVGKATETVEFLESLTNPYDGKPIRVSEWTLGSGGVSDVHGDPGHYDGRAFDIPMDQAPYGKEVEMQQWLMKELNGWLRKKGVPASGLSTSG